MSLPTVTAARIFKAQRLQNNYDSPEREFLTFERFPNVAVSKTFNINKQTGESGASAHAMFTGTKAIYRTFGYDSDIREMDPTTMLTSQKIKGVVTWAQEVGMATGIVVRSELTDATPGASYAHTFTRYFQCDSEYDGEIPIPDGFHDIAWQMINDSPGKDMNVILGGGRAAYYPETERDSLRSLYGPSDLINGVGDQWPECWRKDGQNLPEKWLQDHAQNGKLIHTKVRLN